MADDGSILFPSITICKGANQLENLRFNMFSPLEKVEILEK